MTRTRALLSLPFFALLAAPALALDQGSAQYQNLLTPLFSGNETIIGQEIVYPDGTPKITTAIVVIPPGNETGWHIHQVPLFVHILEGEVTVDYGDKGVKVYQAGDSLLEAMNWPHNGINRSDKPVRIMAVYMGVEGTPDAEPVDPPQ